MFYLARMLEGGEDPKFIARRLIILASEDIGPANNAALSLALATFQAVERIGMPESQIILAHATISLSRAPKSRVAVDAIHRAVAAVKQYPQAEVPTHLRNAPTSLMKDLGYGKGTKWEAGFVHPEGFMPEGLGHLKLYEPDK